MGTDGYGQLWIMYGGEGGIRTPDSLATMSDFESGAFNRALPPLRFVYNNLGSCGKLPLPPVSVVVSVGTLC